MHEQRPSITLLVISVVFTFTAATAVWMFISGVGSIATQVGLFGLGVSLGPCFAAYALAPIRRKQTMRRLVLLTGGLTILAFSIIASANLDLEGFFLLLFEGVAGVAVGHTIVTLILGPVLFGRFLCGWGCWRAMILELLPLGRGDGRRHGIHRWLPYVSLLACAAAAGFGFFLFDHHAGGVPGSTYRAGTLSLLIGFAVYYAAAVGIAIVINDQRAFCKYLCPNLSILRPTSRLALLKIGAREEVCNDCGACTKVCPMDIDVRAIVRSGTRVGTGECILCQRCVQACPRDALRATFQLR